MQAEIITGDCLDVLGQLEPGMSIWYSLTLPTIRASSTIGTSTRCRRPSSCLVRGVDLASVKTLAADGSMWVLISDEWAGDFSRLMRAAGLHPRNWVIWYETFGVNCTHKFNRTKRHLLYMVRDPRRFTFNRPQCPGRATGRRSTRTSEPTHAASCWMTSGRFPGLLEPTLSESRKCRHSSPRNCSVASWDVRRTLVTWWSIRSQDRERPRPCAWRWGGGFWESKSHRNMLNSRDDALPDCPLPRRRAMQ